ncbi:FAD-dependent monooxygenase [Maritimibacter sp. UBA3975]|uniref:FAD-dependent monooxygenase n=1 Tax=Maritimibacter sp. UBA3975 TaxID=1946833 RepID=UPI000C09AAC6|nr:FAD-dependent monooxygenase [Maritimibacter sp. UBA3975]MAM62248.1 monooxygenase [Maritimibacter sp.]|tara:strand:- start:10034 stop:11611 length:1578 start_codon:yes stop_codon:yes gene_type:complete
MADRIEYDVIIAGGGPVGMGLAIELGQRGIPVLVIERYPEPQPIPKGQNLTQRTTETLHFWGCERELRAARSIPDSVGIGGLTLYGHLMSDYHYDWLNRASVNEYYYTTNERLPQYETERVLRDRAAQIDCIDIRYGWSVEAVSDTGDHVEVVATQREGGARRTFTAHYVVGCDGSRSTVRETGGIPQIQSDHDKLMVLLVFRSMELHELLKRYPGKAFYNVLHPDLKGYWQFFGRVDIGSFFFHAPVPDGSTDADDFKALLQQVVGQPVDLEIDYVGFWDLRVSIATRYRAGRVFVAGDAAHSHPPYGGYGINTGFEDARNLGWKLAARLQGWGSEALLDSYDAERRPVFASTARDFIEYFIEEDRAFLETHDPSQDRAAFENAWAKRAATGAAVTNFEPNYEGSPIVADPAGSPSARGTHSFTARAGHHLAPQTLSDGANVFERLGDGYTLLNFGAPGAGAGCADLAKQAGIPFDIVEDSADTAYGASLILVRPDHYVAWAGDDPADCVAALATVSGLEQAVD